MTEQERACRDRLFRLMRENPDLPVIPMVGDDVVADDSCRWWGAKLDRSEVTEIYYGEEYYHIKYMYDIDGVLNDIRGYDFLNPYIAPDGRELDDFTDEEREKFYESLPWEECIIVYVNN